MISQGGGPRTLCGVTCSDKQMGEVKRVLAWRHKSAEPIEAERAGTSDPVSGSACKLAKVKETESMVDASLEHELANSVGKTALCFGNGLVECWSVLEIYGLETCGHSQDGQWIYLRCLLTRFHTG